MNKEEPFRLKDLHKENSHHHQEMARVREKAKAKAREKAKTEKEDTMKAKAKKVKTAQEVPEDHPQETEKVAEEDGSTTKTDKKNYNVTPKEQVQQDVERFPFLKHFPTGSKEMVAKTGTKSNVL